MATHPQAEITVYYAGNAAVGYHMEDDVGLILTSYKYTPPEAKTEYVSVPGRDGDLDFTEVLYGSNGTVHYGNGRLELNFTAPGDSLSVRNLLMVAGFHGHRVVVHIPDGFLAAMDFIGRISVGEIESAMLWGQVTMTVNVESRRNAT